MSYFDYIYSNKKKFIQNLVWEPIYKNKNELRKNKIKRIFEIDMHQSNDGTLGSYPNS